MLVSIDGRAAFYGDKSIDRSVETLEWTAEVGLGSCVEVGRNRPRPSQLAADPVAADGPTFQKLVYEDKLAAVFVPAKCTVPPGKTPGPRASRRTHKPSRKYKLRRECRARGPSPV